MTLDEEIDLIHKLLDHMIQQPGNRTYIFVDEGRIGLTRSNASLILSRLVAQNLVVTIPNPNQHGVIFLSPPGRDIAQGEGGYKGHLVRAKQQDQQRTQAAAAQQDREREAVELARISAEASDRSARAAEQSVLWAKVSGVVALMALIVAVIALFK